MIGAEALKPSEKQHAEQEDRAKADNQQERDSKMTGVTGTTTSQTLQSAKTPQSQS